MKEQYNYEERLIELNNGKDITFRNILEPFIYNSIDKFNNKKIFSVLDVGCGCGFLTMKIKEKFNEANVEGIDISNSAINCANKNFNLKFTNINILDLNLENKYDVLVYNMVLHNLENIDLVMKKSSHHLNPLGIIIITLPHPIYWLKDKINKGKILLDIEFNYNEEKSYKIPFKIKNGINHKNLLTYYHRTLTTYMNTFSKYYNIIEFLETDYKNNYPTMLNLVLQKKIK